MPRPVAGAQHGELTGEQTIDLLGWGDPAFPSDEARRAAWEEHGPRMLATRDNALPGTRPKAHWDYSPDAPRDEDFLVPARDVYEYASDPDELMVDSYALWEAQIRYLAERGELRDDELQRLVDDVPAKANWVPEAQEAARRRLGAAHEGLAAGQGVEEEGPHEPPQGARLSNARRSRPCPPASRRR